MYTICYRKQNVPLPLKMMSQEIEYDLKIHRGHLHVITTVATSNHLTMHALKTYVAQTKRFCP